MKKIVGLLLVFLTSTATLTAQNGIKFTKGLSWAQIKEKARTEKRYIFVDTYTTWCLPCKEMEKEIFPQQAVGDFFNANFINVAFQLDVTKKDNEEVRRRYDDARYFEKTFSIKSYPTYLFFDPSGELVHTVDGASKTAEDFIAKAKKALDPATQVNALKKQFDAGRRDPEFLLRLISTSNSAKSDPFTRNVVNEYLKTQSDLLTEPNLKFIADATTRITDPGFRVLRSQPHKIDAVSEPGTASELIKTILFDEIAVPYLRNGGHREDLPNGSFAYTGEVRDSVDWAGLQKKYAAGYPELAAELLTLSKCEYYAWQEDWPSYVKSVSNYISGFPDDLSNQRLNSYCKEIIAWCSDPQTLKEALAWSERLQAATQRKNGTYLYNYGLLLYKSGQKDDAIRVMNEAAELNKAWAKGFERVIKMVNNGEKLWVK